MNSGSPKEPSGVTMAKQLAFYRMDQSMVTDYPIIDWTAYPCPEWKYQVPPGWRQSHHVTVVFTMRLPKQPPGLKPANPEQYLTNIAWSPMINGVFIAVFNREQNHTWLKQYDATTGDFVNTLHEETDSKYVEPLKPMLFKEQSLISSSGKAGKTDGIICIS